MDKDAVKFFRKHAGWGYDPKTETAAQGRTRGARLLAEAEAFAREQGWECVWDWDEMGCSGCDCGSDDCACSSGAEHEVLGATLKDANGNLIAGLYGICEPSREYRRVVEAELAMEAMSRIMDADNKMAVSG